MCVGERVMQPWKIDLLLLMQLRRFEDLVCGSHATSYKVSVIERIVLVVSMI
jgi:hypothetical protein